MKKSQLRNIIRGIIREQDDLEKNKLRPIKPEEPPRPLSTPNSHHRFRIKYCTPHPTYGVGYEQTYHLYQPTNPYHQGGLHLEIQVKPTLVLLGPI